MLCKRFTTYFVYNFTLLCFIEPSMSIIKTKTTLYQPPTVLIFVFKQKSSICRVYSSKYEIESLYGSFLSFIFSRDSVSFVMKLWMHHKTSQWKYYF